MTDLIEVSDAQDYFKIGAIRSYQIESVPLDSSAWQIVLILQNGDFRRIGTARGALRVYKSLETAVNVLGDIGFKVDGLTAALKR